MKLEDFKRMTLEARLDYLFEHSVKKPEENFVAAVDKWHHQSNCDHDWEDIGNGKQQCNYPECQLVRTEDHK